MGPRNTFTGACFFLKNVLPTQKSPTFVHNSFYIYGDWEVLPQNLQNFHNFTPGLGRKNSYAAGSGTCVCEEKLEQHGRRLQLGQPHDHATLAARVLSGGRASN